MLNRCISLVVAVLAFIGGGMAPAATALAEDPEHTGDPGPVIIFHRLEFVGDLVLPMGPLEEVFQPLAGTELSMEDLQSLINVVESYYAQNGYPFVLAYFPEQTIEEGVVSMAVVVGRYGRIFLDNRSRLRTSVVNKLFRSIVPDIPIYAPDLDGKVSRLQAFPGVEADVLYAAGEHFGQTDVTLEIGDGSRWRGGVTAAAAGPYLFRQAKWAADVAFFNAFGLADRIDVTYSTDGASSSRVDATYEMPVGASLDYNLRVNASASNYRLAGSWAGLGSGWNQGVGVGVERSWMGPTGALWRGNLTARHDGALDEFLGVVTSNEVVSLRGTVERTLGAEQGTSPSVFRPQRWALHLVAGQLTLGTPAQRSLDAATAKTEGVYGLIRFDVDWKAPLARGTVAVQLKGQLASKNLASAEKFSLAEAVRSGLEGRGTGDDGWSVQTEYSSGPGSISFVPGALLATAFVDAGGVVYNKTPWDVTGRGGRTAAAVGFRLDWQPVDGLTVRIQQGWTVFDSAAIVSPGQAGPLSFSMTYSF